MALAGTTVAMPRVALARVDSRPEVVIAVQALTTSNTLDPLAEQPNVGERILNSYVIVSGTLVFPEIILAASGLSFLGLGVQPPMTSLGNMIGYGRAYIGSAPWILLFPSLIIVLTTLAISMAGDWVRDRLDPTLA